MKKHRGKPLSTITSKEVDSYSEEHTTPESDDIQKLIKSSDQELEYIDMLSGRVVGQLLKMIVAISGAKKILEIGTFTGYSAIMMAEALPDDGKVTTLEMNLRYQDLAQHHFDISSVGDKINLIKGNAQQTLDLITGTFDMVYLDGDKLRYSWYFDKCLPMLNKGGLIIADNVLWDATVLEPDNNKSVALDEFNKKVAEDPRVEQVLLPIRDGVSVIRKL